METMMVQTFQLRAPISGLLVPLEQIPDPVFAQRLIGDGISIDPTENLLVAPCSGRIVQAHPAGHALTLRTESGQEILFHIGIDTVSLHGKGFEMLVAEGREVQAGTPLVRFDMDYVATNARSLLTQIIVMGSSKLKAAPTGRSVVANCDTILTLLAGDDAPQDEPQNAGAAVSELSAPLRIGNPHGLHARPVGRLSHAAKGFKADIQLICREQSANAKSPTALLKLQVHHGDHVLIKATGADALAAVGKLTELIKSGLGEVVTAVKSHVVMPTDTLQGISVSPGLVAAPLFQVSSRPMIIEEYGSKESTKERAKLEGALVQARRELEGLIAHSDVFQAHLELLDDPEILGMAEREIARGKSAAYAWDRAITCEVDGLARLEDELLAARAADLRDVGQRVLRLMLGTQDQAENWPEQCILIADDVSLSQMAALDRQRVRGICTAQGNATSHMAILARASGIPTVVGLGSELLTLPNATPAILEASRGTLRLNPSAEQRSKLAADEAQRQARREIEHQARHAPAVTLDGQTITVMANIGDVAESRQVLENGGEGIGLLRSEFLFQNRPGAPDVSEQQRMYREVLEAVGPRGPVQIRTLDVGGDKPLAYLPLPRESNPFLGIRGVRVFRDDATLLRAQLRALLLADPRNQQLEIMLPMVTTLEEVLSVKKILAALCAELKRLMPRLGIMVEVPAVAAMAEVFAREVDFFSIGTNDLTQYAVAIDRGHPTLGSQASGLHPGVLALIAATVAGARVHQRPVSLCGAMAGDPLAVPILIGLGVGKLSVPVAAIAEIKARIRTLRYELCQELARKALSCRGAGEVENLVKENMPL